MELIKVERLTQERRSQLGIPAICQNKGDWSVWECAPSTFEWHYDEMEYAYIYEGEANVKTPDGQDILIKIGDFVTFPKGLSCLWTVVKTIRKVYMFP